MFIDNELCYAIIEKDSMFLGGWKVSFRNCVASIMMVCDNIHINYDFDEYMKDVEKEKNERKNRIQ